MGKKIKRFAVGVIFCTPLFFLPGESQSFHCWPYACWPKEFQEELKEKDKPLKNKTLVHKDDPKDQKGGKK